VLLSSSVDGKLLEAGEERDVPQHGIVAGDQLSVFDWEPAEAQRIPRASATSSGRRWTRNRCLASTKARMTPR